MNLTACLRDLIVESEMKYNSAVYISPERLSSIVKWRHHLIKLLCKEQLKYFDRES